MAKKSDTKESSDNTNVTRIKAVDSAKTPEVKKSESPKVTTPADREKKRRNPFKALGTYFKGAWYELRQVRWPNRKATWELTGAVLLFTAFFVVLIVALDAGFQYLFDLMIG